MKISINNLMNTFDSDRYDDYEYDSKEESQLLQKFNDYVNLEKDIKKREFLEISDNSKLGKFGKRFIISAMIQGAIVTGLTIALFMNQLFVFNGNIENMFEFAFTDKSGIFIFGFLLQIGLTAGLATTGLFYNHIETNLKKSFSKHNTLLSWTHLIGINVFGSIITSSLIFAGISTSALYQTELSYLLKSIPTIVYISASGFVIVLGIGIIGTAYLLMRNKSTV